MPTNNHITKIDNLIDIRFMNKTGCLEEPAENMKVPVIPTGKSIVYSFDIAQKKGTTYKDLFPYFKPIKGAHTMCDYMIFAQQAGRLFILLVELKKGGAQPGPQLRAGKVFASFIADTLNRIHKLNITPEIRMISVHNSKIIKKGTTRNKEVRFDSDGFADFKGNTFCIKEFLQ